METYVQCGDDQYGVVGTSCSGDEQMIEMGKPRTSESTCDAPMVLLKLLESLNRCLKINQWSIGILQSDALLTNPLAERIYAGEVGPLL